jgi:DNA-binding MarR family transcriptional regulator
MDDKRFVDPEFLTADLLSQIDLQAFLSVLSAATRIIGATERILRDSDIPLTAKEWDALAFVATNSPIRPSDLLRRVTLTTNPQTLSSVLDRLEERGLVARSPHRTDARGIEISITDQGTRTIHELFPLLSRHVVSSFSGHFTDDEIKTIAELLSRL